MVAPSCDLWSFGLWACCTRKHCSHLLNRNLKQKSDIFFLKKCAGIFRTFPREEVLVIAKFRVK